MDCFIYLHALYLIYTNIYILFMTSLFALVVYWFHFLRQHSFSRICIYLLITYITLRERAFPRFIGFHYVFTWRFEFILICKQKCFAARYTTIRDFSRIHRVLYHFVFTTYWAETFAFAEYLRCGYYLTSLSYVAE